MISRLEFADGFGRWRRRWKELFRSFQGRCRRNLGVQRDVELYMLSVGIYNGFFGLLLVEQQALEPLPTLLLLLLLLLQLNRGHPLLRYLVVGLVVQKAGYLSEVKLRMYSVGTLLYLVAV